MSKTIITGCHGIVVELTGDGGGSITSDLHEPEPERKYCNTELELQQHTNEFLDESAKVNSYNSMMDALESIILAHACAGIDIATPAYLEGIETACNACAKATE